MLNRVELIGRLGKDAETRFTQSGVAVTNFTLATDFRQKNKATEQWESITEWHNCVLWRAENVANLLVKGKLVYIEGRLKTSSYEKDGERRYKTEVHVTDVKLLSPKQGGEREADPSAGGPADASDDIPF